MANDIYFLFRSRDLQTLIDKGAVTIQTFSRLERAVINSKGAPKGGADGKTVAVMVVKAEGFDAANHSVGVVGGCPCPPCTAKTATKYI